MQSTADSHSILIESLLDPAAWPWPAERVEKIETHISVVLLAGEHVLKIKKPVDFGFLDFGTLERRRRFCEEELRLNRRLAPDLYLDVIAFTGDPAHPRFGGEGEAFEYAVHMRRFDQEGLLDRVLARGELTPALVDRIAEQSAAFHERAECAGPDSPFGTPEAALAPMTQNFEQLRPLHDDPAVLAQLDRLEAWTNAQFERLRPLLAARKRDGFVRECHGDMHLGNMALVGGEVTIFDAIEFNDWFRWIDVMSEVAFFTMDLADRGADALAQRFLDGWLAKSGDYAGLALLRFYQVYRALVRGKVASLRLGQGGLADAERQDILTRYRGYADLAERFTRPGTPALLLMHGFSGCGKSTVALELVERHGAIRLRSDVERKRLAGLAGTDRPDAGIGTGLYGADMTAATYARLAALAGSLLDAGFPVVVDATFLDRAERDRFAQITRERGVPLRIIDVQAPAEVLRERVAARAASGADPSGADPSDAGLAVLEHQIAHHDPLGADEPVTVVDSASGLPSGFSPGG